MLTNWIRVNNRAAIWREMYVMRFVDTRKTPRTPFYLYARIHFIRCQMNRFTRICGNRVKALNDNATKKNKNSRKQNNNLLGTSERNNWSASRCIFLLHFSAIPSNFPLVCVLFIFEVLFFAPLRPPFPSLTRCPVFIHQLVASFFYRPASFHHICKRKDMNTVCLSSFRSFQCLLKIYLCAVTWSLYSFCLCRSYVSFFVFPFALSS